MRNFDKHERKILFFDQISYPGLCQWRRTNFIFSYPPPPPNQQKYTRGNKILFMKVSTFTILGEEKKPSQASTSKRKLKKKWLTEEVPIKFLFFLLFAFKGIFENSSSPSKIIFFFLEEGQNWISNWIRIPLLTPPPSPWDFWKTKRKKSLAREVCQKRDISERGRKGSPLSTLTLFAQGCCGHLGHCAISNGSSYQKWIFFIKNMQNIFLLYNFFKKKNKKKKTVFSEKTEKNCFGAHLSIF